MSGGSGGFTWTVLVLTCQHKDSVHSFQRELELRQQRGGVCQGTLVLTVQDRQEPLGSGGATINALLVAAEHLSNRAGHTVVSADVLDDAHILILHTGRDFPWSSCSRAFCWLPQEEPSQRVQAPVCCLDLLLDRLKNQICPGSPPGVWVCSTDMVLTVPPDFALSWTGFSGVRVLALPGDVSYAASHGVYLSDPQGRVKDVIYRGTREQIEPAAMPDGKVPLVSGPVFFSRSVSEKLLQAHVTPPLDGCTYLGLDSGAPPLQISLFLDVLKCLCSDLTQDQFVSEERVGCASAVGPQRALVRSGRTELWRILRGSPLSLVYIRGGRYDYLTLSGKQHVRRLTCDQTNTNTLSYIQSESCVRAGARVINSVLEGEVAVAAGAVVQHCHLQGPLEVGPGCLLSGLELSASSCVRQLQLTDDIIIQGHRIELGQIKLKVYTVVGADDDLEASCDDTNASFLNHRWSLFFNRTGIQPDELWGSGEPRSLLEARLFPALHPREGDVGVKAGVGWLLGRAGSLRAWREAWRLSLKEVLRLTHQEGELRWREELLFLAGRRRAFEALMNGTDVCLLPVFRAAVLGGQQGALLETLDNIAADGRKQDRDSGLGVAARCLSCIADVLVCMAGGKGGLRSGPAANEAWSAAYRLLEEGDLRGGVHALAAERENWLSRPDLLVRAARHYEGAGQVLLRQAVMSSHSFISIGQGEVPPLGEWQEVECPARLDLAGGWSDTPPIAFEHGGSVTNIAVKVDGKRPIGARARRIPEPHLLLVSYSGGRASEVTTETLCSSLDDLKDYCQPHAPGALLKAVCVCSGLVALSSQHPLGHQLKQKWGAGLELQSWSELPTGSGLGTSSILAGALLAAVYRCTGRTYDTDSLIHGVLYLEQMLTTGGGWQDQVGGLVGGVKVGRSRASLPLQVEVERLRPPEDFLTSLDQHLLLVYTGKTRLARNLLQDVVRSWYSRLPSMVQNAQQLVANSEECARACKEGCLSTLGHCLDRSWQQKKLMAPGCEPASVRAMMDALRPLVLGQSLAGAGGGGFLYLVTREPEQQQAVLQVLKKTQLLSERLMGAEGTELDEDFTKMQKSVAVIHALLLELLSRTTQFLQPNPAHRARLSMCNTVSRIRGQAGWTGYPQTERMLGDCMLHYGRELGAASDFGGALVCVGEALQQVAEDRDTLDVSIQRTFVDPLRDLHNTELREIRYQLKKLNGRRLDFDYKRRQRGKTPAEELGQAWDKFVTSKELTERSMFALLHSEVDRLGRLAALITALLNFHRNAQRTLLGLQGNLQVRLTAASNKPQRHFRPTKIRVRTEQNGSTGFYQQPSALSSGSEVTEVPSGPGSPISCYADSGLVLDQPCCRALYSFHPSHESELSFGEGDLILLKGQVDAHWYQGELGGRAGLFPVTYVDVLVPLPLP